MLEITLPKILQGSLDPLLVELGFRISLVSKVLGSLSSRVPDSKT